MNFLRYLYSKYYYFQIKVGNADIAKYTPLLLITFFLNFYIVFFLLLIKILFKVNFLEFSKEIYFSVFFLIILLLYILLVYNMRYQEIINNDNIKSKKSLLAVLFPIVGFILFNLSCIIMMLHNQNR